MNLKGRHMWKKIIPREETNENKIIYYPFKITNKILRWIGNFHIQVQVLSQYPNTEKLHIPEKLSQINKFPIIASILHE